jgi:hypothetical protein
VIWGLVLPTWADKDTTLAMELKRREFLKSGAGAAAAWLALPVVAGAAQASENFPKPSREAAYKTSWYPFTGHPDAATCWSVSVGPEGRIYAAACAESVPGGVVKVVRYNEHTDELDYLFSLDKMVNDPGHSGRATQRKIRYSFAPSMADGILYMATNLGVAESVLERRRYGYVFGDAVIGRDGQIIFGEDDDLGHLWLYFPRIQTPARRGRTAGVSQGLEISQATQD